MVSFGIVQLVPLLLIWAITVVPMYFIVRRVGMSPWWLLFLIVPFWGLIVLLWIVAFKRWPKEDIAERFA